MERYKEENPVARTLVTSAEILGDLLTVAIYGLIFVVPLAIVLRHNDPIAYLNSQVQLNPILFMLLSFLYGYFIYIIVSRTRGWLSKILSQFRLLTADGFSEPETLRLGIAHSSYEYLSMLAGIWYIIPMIILLRQGVGIVAVMVLSLVILILQRMLYKKLNMEIGLDSKIGYLLFNKMGGETDWKQNLWMHHSGSVTEFVGCPDCGWKEKVGQNAFELKQKRCDTSCEAELKYGTVGSGWDDEDESSSNN